MEVLTKIFEYSRLLRDSDKAASMVEYALLVTLIALVALIAVQLAGQELSSTYSEIASAAGT